MAEMDYLELLKRQRADGEALVEDGRGYSYGELADRAEALARSWQSEEIAPGKVHVIKEEKILQQLLGFLACFVVGEIPLVVAADNSYFSRNERLMNVEVPAQACMAVSTSGTSGVPKIYFRRYESWADYFPIQNQIFHIHKESRLFVQGSLSFTGNMNLYMAQFYAGGTIVAENEFRPREWQERLLSQRVNGIYLIPSKLMLMPEVLQREFPRVETIISGSQSLGKNDAAELKKVFPQAHITLYYGATELNYMTYVTDDMMTEDRNLIGRAFPGVRVFVEQGEIYIDTPYHVEGISCPYTLRDKGTMDGEGNLYFEGRNDDILLYRGHKVSALKLENMLAEMPEVEEAAVCLVESDRWKGEHIVAYVTSRKEKFQEGEMLERLRNRLPRHEIPKRICLREELPRNASGKVDKKRLHVLK